VPIKMLGQNVHVISRIAIRYLFGVLLQFCVQSRVTRYRAIFSPGL